MPTLHHTTLLSTSSNLPSYTTPYHQRYQQYSDTIEFSSKPLESDQPPKENRLLHHESVSIWLDNNCPLTLHKVGFVICARVMSLSKQRIEIDISDHEHRIKAHDITMRLHLNNSRYPNKGRFCEWIISCLELSNDGKYIHCMINKTHAERPWLRSMDQIPKYSVGTVEQLSLIDSPWRYMPFVDKAGNSIVGLLTIRDAQTIHFAFVNTSIKIENQHVNCAEVRFDKLTFGRMFGVYIQMTSHTINSDPLVDDTIDIRLEIMNTESYITSFRLNQPFILPFTKFAILDQQNDEIIKKIPECTWNDKPFRIDVMDITNDHTAVLKISRTAWNNPVADSTGDWRVATVQLDIEKYVYLDPGVNILITLRAINNYSSDPVSVEQHGPPAIELLVQDENINKKLQTQQNNNGTTSNSTGNDDLDQILKKGSFGRQTANTDMQIKGFISGALGGL